MKNLKITNFIHNICHMYYYFLLYVMLKSQKIDLYFKIYEYVSCQCRTGVGHRHVSDTATRPQNEVSMLLSSRLKRKPTLLLKWKNLVSNSLLNLI